MKAYRTITNNPSPYIKDELVLVSRIDIIIIIILTIMSKEWTSAPQANEDPTHFLLTGKSSLRYTIFSDVDMERRASDS
jgi:hypothetical protein